MKCKLLFTCTLYFEIVCPKLKTKTLSLTKIWSALKFTDSRATLSIWFLHVSHEAKAITANFSCLYSYRISCSPAYFSTIEETRYVVFINLYSNLIGLRFFFKSRDKIYHHESILFSYFLSLPYLEKWLVRY